MGHGEDEGLNQSAGFAIKLLGVAEGALIEEVLENVIVRQLGLAPADVPIGIEVGHLAGHYA